MGRIAIVACAAVVGCSGEEPSAESAHIRLFVEPGVMCDRELAESLAYLEQAAVTAADFLELNFTSQIDYHLISRGQWPEGSPCPDDSLGCASNGNAWSIFPLAHELVHALEYRHLGYNTVSFFAEGLAVALGDYPYPDPIPIEVDFDVELAKLKIEQSQYNDAGELTSYLLAAYGPAKFLDLARRIEWGTSVANVRAAFIDVYGMSLEAMLDERVTRNWGFGGTLGIAPCGAVPPLAWQDGVHHSQTLGCEHGSFRAVVDVPETGAYRIDYMTSSYQTSISLRNCRFGFGVEAPYDGFGDGNYYSPNETSLAHLRKGRYMMSAYQVEGATASLDLYPAAATCTDSLVFAADQDRLTIFPASGATQRIAVTSDVMTDVEVEFSYYKPMAVATCSSCTGPCQPIADHHQLRLQPNTVEILEVTASTWGSGISLQADRP